MIAEIGTGVDRSSGVYATFLSWSRRAWRPREITERHPPETLADMIVGSLVGGLVDWSADQTYSIRTGLHDVGVALADLLAPRDLGGPVPDDDIQRFMTDPTEWFDRRCTKMHSIPRKELDDLLREAMAIRFADHKESIEAVGKAARADRHHRTAELEDVVP